MQSSLRGMVDFIATNLGSEGNTLAVQALVLSEITSVLPSHPVSLDCMWKHLTNIWLADSEFSTQGNIDLLLRANVFSCAVLHVQWFRPLGTPSAFKTCFQWVLAGFIHGQPWRGEAGMYYLSTTSVDDLLKWFGEIEDYNLHQPVLSLDQQLVVEPPTGHTAEMILEDTSCHLPVKLMSHPWENQNLWL